MLAVDGGSGHSATLEWERIPGAKQYIIQYRRLGSHEYLVDHEVPGQSAETVLIPHTHIRWAEGADWPYYGGRQPEKRVNQPNTEFPSAVIPDLESGEIYAFQLNYERSDGGMVYSARDVFVWPSSEKPGNAERVATYTFFGHHPTREFEYIICEDTFPNDMFPSGPDLSPPQGTPGSYTKRDSWVAIIERGFEEWELATNGLVKVTRDLVGTCASLSSNFQRLIIAQDDVQSEVRMFDVSSSGMSIWSFPEVKSDAFKYCVNLAARLHHFLHGILRHWGR